MLDSNAALRNAPAAFISRKTGFWTAGGNPVTFRLLLESLLEHQTRSQTMSQENQKPWLKWLVVFILLAVCGGAGAWYYFNNREGATEYQVAGVERGDLTQVVTATGQLCPVLNVQVGS